MMALIAMRRGSVDTRVERTRQVFGRSLTLNAVGDSEFFPLSHAGDMMSISSIFSL